MHARSWARWTRSASWAAPHVCEPRATGQAGRPCVRAGSEKRGREPVPAQRPRWRRPAYRLQATAGNGVDPRPRTESRNLRRLVAVTWKATRPDRLRPAFHRPDRFACPPARRRSRMAFVPHIRSHGPDRRADSGTGRLRSSRRPRPCRPASVLPRLSRFHHRAGTRGSGCRRRGTAGRIAERQADHCLGGKQAFRKPCGLG